MNLNGKLYVVGGADATNSVKFAKLEAYTP